MTLNTEVSTKSAPIAQCGLGDHALTKPTTGCPSLFRIVPALDGGICRIKLSLGVITSEQAIAVANAARRFGNGQIEVTNRSNLQIRGVTELHQHALIEAMVEAGLGANSADSDDVRNVMVNPTIGIDQKFIIDTAPLAQQILDTLQTRSLFHHLSAKFSIYLDGGESVAHVEHPHDIWLSAIERADEPSFLIGFANSPVSKDDLPKLIVSAENAFDVVILALEMFMDLRRETPEITRFRHLRDSGKLNQFIEDLSRKNSSIKLQDTELNKWERTVAHQKDSIGIHHQRQKGFIYLGAKPALGRIKPDTLELIAHVAKIVGDGTFRVTPWQSIILPNIKEENASLAITKLTFAGLVCEIEDPLVSMIACAGSTGCKSAFADTKADGIELAYMLKRKSLPINIHLSGCAKSCASPSAAEVSLVAVSADHYDVYKRQQIGQSGFGKLVIKNLTITQVADYLEQLT